MHPPKGRILCAEDDHDARELIIFTLRLNGYQVTCVETGTRSSVSREE
jgi:CheY-like chemotaxis protein